MRFPDPAIDPTRVVGVRPSARGDLLQTRRRHRPAVNITAVERAGCVVVGLAAVFVGVILLTMAASVIAVVVEVLLVAAGVDLVVTGALGHWPRYAKAGAMALSSISVVTNANRLCRTDLTARTTSAPINLSPDISETAEVAA